MAWLITGLLLLLLFAHLVQSAAVSASGGGLGGQQSTGFAPGGPYLYRGSAGPPAAYPGQGGQTFVP